VDVKVFLPEICVIIWRRGHVATGREKAFDPKICPISDGSVAS
jgi:hypothetical protein